VTKVVEIRGNLEIRPGGVYRIPPNQHRSVTAGVLHRSAPLDRRPRRADSGSTASSWRRAAGRSGARLRS